MTFYVQEHQRYGMDGPTAAQLLKDSLATVGMFPPRTFSGIAVQRINVPQPEITYHIAPYGPNPLLAYRDVANSTITIPRRRDAAYIEGYTGDTLVTVMRPEQTKPSNRRTRPDTTEQLLHKVAPLVELVGNLSVRATRVSLQLPARRTDHPRLTIAGRYLTRQERTDFEATLADQAEALRQDDSEPNRWHYVTTGYAGTSKTGGYPVRAAMINQQKKMQATQDPGVLHPYS